MTQIPRSLILITIDCFRADHAGFLGYSGRTTPFLDSLAAESFVFRNAIATGIPTYYSLPAIHASRHPLSLGRDVIGIAPGESTIATELQERGYKTAAFVAANPYASAAFGYNRGFDLFRDFLDPGQADFEQPIGRAALPTLRNRANRLLSRACHSVSALGGAYDGLYFRYCQAVSSSASDSLDQLRKFPSADVISDSAIAWITENAGGPFFLWLHFMDPHGPYYPKPEALAAMGHADLTPADAKYLNSYWRRGDLDTARLQKRRNGILNLYDAGIRWVDEHISRLSASLVDLNLWNQCAMAVTADHGEEFLDHGGRFHSPFRLNEELIRVPLLLRIPGASQGRDIHEPFGLIDLAPTLFDALAVSAPAGFRGRSCWRKVINNQTWQYPVFTECAYGCTNPFRADTRNAPRLLAVRKGNYKLIVNFAAGTEQLFDLNSDPNELSPLPLGVASPVRKDLLECVKKHVAESYKSRDLDLRIAAQARALRLEWAHSTASRPN